MAETETVPAPVSLALLLAEARDALAVERDRADAAEAKVTGYENAVLWSTSCLSCARVLDSCIAETERRVLAEDALAAERERADAAETELGELADRIGDAVRAAVTAERERIRGLAAESRAVCLEPCEDGPSCAHGDHARPFAGLIGEAPDA